MSAKVGACWVLMFWGVMAGGGYAQDKGSPDGDCATLCQEHAEQANADCLEAGGTEEDCAARSRHQLGHCLVERCDQPPPDCDAYCADTARHGYRNCIENGGAEDACGVRARAAGADCFVEHCVLDAECEEACAVGARRVRETEFPERVRHAPVCVDRPTVRPPCLAAWLPRCFSFQTLNFELPSLSSRHGYPAPGRLASLPTS